MRQEFQVHRLNNAGLAKAEALAQHFSATLSAVELIIPRGRELSVVITKLQEACFFAKRAIALDESNQVLG